MILGLTCALVALAAPALVSGLPWDARDVEAAESYRAAERERADRYRARIETPTAPERAPRTAKASPPRVERGEAPQERGFVARVFSRAWGAVLDEFDREAIDSAVRQARTHLRWWQNEGSPRASRVLEWLAGVAGPAGE